jgi:hypothetical protein
LVLAYLLTSGFRSTGVGIFVECRICWRRRICRRGIAVLVGVGIFVDVGVAESVDVGVFVDVGVTVSVGVAVFVDVGVAVFVDVGVAVSVGIGVSSTSESPYLLRGIFVDVDSPH